MAIVFGPTHQNLHLIHKILRLHKGLIASWTRPMAKNSVAPWTKAIAKRTEAQDVVRPLLHHGQGEQPKGPRSKMRLKFSCKLDLGPFGCNPSLDCNQNSVLGQTLFVLAVTFVQIMTEIWLQFGKGSQLKGPGSNLQLNFDHYLDRGRNKINKIQHVTFFLLQSEQGSQPVTKF